VRESGGTAPEYRPAGTGKTFTARLINDLGPRHNRSFVAVDAGILTHQDADLLLFGREPGRSGLSRTGLIERANGGTLLLDEVETASPPLQARLLSVPETRTILPAGAERPRRLNLCVVVTRRMNNHVGLPGEGRSPFSATYGIPAYTYEAGDNSDPAAVRAAAEALAETVIPALAQSLDQD